MSLIKNKIIAPKKFRANTLKKFIDDCSIIFNYINKNEAGLFLDLTKIRECNIIGVLLIYKVMEFSVNKNCFLNPHYEMSSEFSDCISKYGFTNLIQSLIADKIATEKEFENLKISVTDNFIIAPQALLRNDTYSSEILNEKFTPKIQEYYSYDRKVTSMIFTCFSEIFLNFWEHANDDTQSIIVANGHKKNIEIACADNGIGVLSSLNNSGKSSTSDLKTFISSLEKGVTSKKFSNHMGFGLWLIDEIVKRSKGRLHLYSEGYYYQREFDKVEYGKCGFWQGSVIYLSLPLNNPVTLADIEEINTNKLKLNINWG